MKKSLVIGLVLVVALATVGIAYAAWTSTLNVNGTVNTGTMNAIWDDCFTNDDNGVAHAGLDDGDSGGITGSLDPSQAFNGSTVSRYDTGVGSCTSGINSSGDSHLWTFDLSNVYPSYWCTVWASIKPDGSTIPMAIQSITFTPSWTSGEVSVYGPYDATTHALLARGTVINPSTLGTRVYYNIHVESTAAQDTIYSASMQYQLVNWNQYVP
jgi:hypothetical protein